MLVLTRKEHEEIIIDGGIVVKVIWIKGNRCAIGISAPDNVRVLRSELQEQGPDPDSGTGAVRVPEKD